MLTIWLLVPSWYSWKSFDPPKTALSLSCHLTKFSAGLKVTKFVSFVFLTLKSPKNTEPVAVVPVTLIPVAVVSNRLTLSWNKSTDPFNEQSTNVSWLKERNYYYEWIKS